MQVKLLSGTCVAILLAALFVCRPLAYAQEDARPVSAADAATPASSVSNEALAVLIRQLQSQVQDLQQQLKDVRSEQRNDHQAAAELRRELDAAKTQLNATSAPALPGAYSSSSTPMASPAPAVAASSSIISKSPQAAVPAEQQPSIEERIANLEENQQLDEAKITEQSQTKVESGSKYRVRLSGIVLMNLYANRGAVDNQDVPEIATPTPALGSGGAFGGSLRQSQLGLDGFGPELWGARTSASIKFDFAGGFPNTPNGVSEGIVRLRTGTVRFDWTNTSVIAGQDSLFFAPLAPTSLATIATPALSYSGELWGWIPQIRVEHRFQVSEGSKIVVSGGLLDPLSGDVPGDEYRRTPSWGESSGQPAYAAHVAWSQRAFGHEFTLGGGGYYSRQDWGFSRSVDAWAGTVDLTVPLGSRLEFTGQFYRGRAIGGLGGGIGQTAYWEGPLGDPATEVYGLDSIGGWGQLKYKFTPKFQVNAALGVDSPFARELRDSTGSTSYYGAQLSRNLTPLFNFVYQPRSNIVFSFEYRYLHTNILDTAPNTANNINLSVGYMF